VHDSGLVHGDLKPSNILIDRDGPKLVDFGISQALDSMSLTLTGARGATAGFTAPEFAEGRPARASADVFSLGAVLAYAATGIAPFGSGPASAVLYHTVHEPPAPKAVACQDPRLQNLIESCLIKDPDRRPTLEQVKEVSTAGDEHLMTPAILSQIVKHEQDAAALVMRMRVLDTARYAMTPLVHSYSSGRHNRRPSRDHSLIKIELRSEAKRCTAAELINLGPIAPTAIALPRSRSSAVSTRTARHHLRRRQTRALLQFGEPRGRRRASQG
jgi:serine/threonine protein kinase